MAPRMCSECQQARAVLRRPKNCAQVRDTHGSSAHDQYTETYADNVLCILCAFLR